MTMRFHQLLAVFAVLGVFSLAACQPTDDAATMDTDTTTAPNEEPSVAMDGDTAMEGDTAMDDGAMTGAAGSAQIAVTNPMPHAMNVKADWGQGEQMLGAVQPNETKTFDVAAAAGTEVKLTATDDDNTHSPSGSLTLSEGSPAAWTIQ